MMRMVVRGWCSLVRMGRALVSRRVKVLEGDRVALGEGDLVVFLFKVRSLRVGGLFVLSTVTTAAVIGVVVVGGGGRRVRLLMLWQRCSTRHRADTRRRVRVMSRVMRSVVLSILSGMLVLLQEIGSGAVPHLRRWRGKVTHRTKGQRTDNIRVVVRIDLVDSMGCRYCLAEVAHFILVGVATKTPQRPPPSRMRASHPVPLFPERT